MFLKTFKFDLLVFSLLLILFITINHSIAEEIINYDIYEHGEVEDLGLDYIQPYIKTQRSSVPEATSGFQMPMVNDHYGYMYKGWSSLSGCYHPGVDFNGPGNDCGDNIYAVADGVVKWASVSTWGSLVIEHLYKGETWYSQYGHCSSVLVNVGDTVKKGEHVAELGGVPDYSCHLHWEIRKSDHPNPTYGPYWNKTSFQNVSTIDNWYENPENFVNSHGHYNSNDKPDLRVSELTVNKISGSSTNTIEVQQNEEINIDIWISNKGSADADETFHVKYLISNDKVFTKDDSTIATDDISSIAEGDRDHESTTIKIDQVGTYYIGAWADYKNDIDEEDESNNFSDSDDEIAKITVIQPNLKPTGNLDSANCSVIRGWAKDPDSPNSSIQVHLYLDGKYGAGGEWLASITANEYKSDDVGYHSFSFTTPVILKDGNHHTLYLYGIDTEGGVNPLLGSSDIICVDPSYLGYPVYRFCNLNTGTYIYTISESEKDYLSDQNDEWRYEGYPWYCQKEQVTGTLPVYRFCNLQTGGYLYTLSTEEIATVNSNSNWRNEGIKWYSYPQEEPGTLPVYRFCNIDSGVYLYTKNEDEKDTLMSKPDIWRYEGIKWYISTYNQKNATAIEDKESQETTDLQIIPVTSFLADTVSGRAPLTVQFSNTSTGNITGWEWYFGDGSTSNEKNPVHIYPNEGEYTVKLIAVGPEAEQTLEKINFINVEASYQLSDVIVGLQILTGENPFNIGAYDNEKITMNKILHILTSIVNHAN